MAPTSARTQRRQIFLRALASGSSVAEACAHSRLASSSLYYWRQQDAKFRDAWDEALKAGAAALAARFDSEMVRRAIDGVAEPVFHKGEIVGERTRYSDPLLMFAIRDLRLRRQAEAQQAPGSPGAPAPRVTVVIAPLKEDEDE